MFMKTDKEIIDELGGPAKVAALLGISDKPGCIQRIHNWKKRGIPPQVRLDYPDIFPAPKQKKRNRESGHA